MAMTSMELNRKGTGQLCCDAQRQCKELNGNGLARPRGAEIGKGIAAS